MAESPIRIQGIDGAHALRALQHVERRIWKDSERWGAAGDRSAGSHGRYHRYREWLLRERVLRTLLTNSLDPRRSARARGSAVEAVLPGLSVPTALFPRIRRTLRLAGSLADPRQRTVLETRADAVFGNSNLRGFYLSGREPLTVKVAVRAPETSFYEPLNPLERLNGHPAVKVEEARAESPPQADWLGREIAAREYAGAFVDAPELLGHELTGPFPYVVERVVTGRRPSSPEALARVGAALLPRLLRLYEDYGYRFVTPAEVLKEADLPDGADVMGEVEAGLELLGTHPSGIVALLSAIGGLLETARVVAVSFTHGDLAPNNLCVTEDGRVVLLDWEQAGEDLVAKDLRVLLGNGRQEQDRLGEAAFRSQAASAPAAGLCSLGEQLAVLGVRELAQWRRLWRQREWGRSERQVKRRLRSNRNLLEPLLREVR